MKVIRGVANAIDKSIPHICGALIVLCLIASILDVGSRFTVGNSLPWAHLISQWAVIMLTWIFCGVIIREHGHISVEFISNRFKGRLAWVATLIITMAAVAFTGIAAYASIALVIYLIQHNTTIILGVWSLSEWPIKLICITIGSVVTFIYAVITLKEDAKKPIRGK